MNLAFGDFAPALPSDVPWIPATEESETEDACVEHVEVPGGRKDQLDVQATDRELVITARSPGPGTARGGGAAPAGPASSSTGRCCPVTSRPVR